MFRGPFEPTDRPPKYPKLLFARWAELPNLLNEPPPICRGADGRAPRKLLPPECPPPPRWNPPPPLLPPWNPPPPREPPWWEPPPPREPPPRCLPKTGFSAPARANARKELNRARKTLGGVLNSVSSSPGARPRGEIAILESRTEAAAISSTFFRAPHWGRSNSMTRWVVWEQVLGRKTQKHTVERKVVMVWMRWQLFSGLQDPPNTGAFCCQSLSESNGRWSQYSKRLTVAANS
jgi:hypothetical protein